MSIIKETCYGVICNRCGKLFEHPFTGFSLWTDENTPIEESEESGWLRVREDEMDYCPDCYTVDGEIDEVTIK